MMVPVVHEAGDPAGSRTLVWLHGFMGSGTQGCRLWDDRGRRKGWRVLCPDLPGHGASSGFDPVALDDVAGLLLAALPPGPFDLLGYSMGGRIALYLARSAPDRVRGLVLESAHPGLASGAERARRVRDDQEVADRLAACTSPEAHRVFLEAWYRQDVFLRAGHPPADVEDRMRDALQGSPSAHARALRTWSLGHQDDFWSFLSGRQRPTLYIHGERDRKYAEIGRTLSGSTERIRVLAVGDAGHAVHRDAPVAYLDAVTAFLNQPVS